MALHFLMSYSRRCGWFLSDDEHFSERFACTECIEQRHWFNIMILSNWFKVLDKGWRTGALSDSAPD